MKNNLSLLIFISLFALAIACEKEPVTEDPCESIGATFSSDGGKMVGIFESKCGISGCHVTGSVAGDSAWNFVAQYDSLAPYFNLMYDAVVNFGFMPPDTMPQLSDTDMDVFECWKEAGFPE